MRAEARWEDRRRAPVYYTEDTQRGRILAALRHARGRMVSVTALIEAMYRDRADGGAEDARRVVHVTVYDLRKQGHPIGGGRSAGGYCWDG